MKAIINGFLVLLLGLLWASESVLGKLSLELNTGLFDFPLILNIGTVITVSLLCLHPKHRRSVSGWKITTLFWMVCVALSLVFVPYCIIYLALCQITPAEASLITSLTPVFSMLFGMVVFRTRVKILPVLALVLGVIGVGLMIIPRLDQGTGKIGAIWYILMLFVPLSYAASGYFLKKCANLNTSYIQMLLVTNSISAGLFLALNGRLPIFYSENNSLIYILGIIINMSAIALMLFISGRMNPLALSFSNYATLMFSFVLSAIIFSQHFTFSLIAAVTLIVISSLIVQEKNNAQIYYK